MMAIILPKTQLILLAGVAVGAFVLLVLLKSLLAKPAAATAYKTRERVLTPAERSFFGALEMSLRSPYRVFPKIRLADLIAPAVGADRGTFQSAFNRIAAKHVDFTICRESDLAILAVVELDDKSHQHPERQLRDRFLEQALQTAGVPLLRIKAARSYDTAQLSSQLTTLLNSKATVAISQ